MDEERTGSMTCREAGKIGGAAAKKKLGTEHYKRIGSMGGNKVAQTHGPEFFRKIGKLGAKIKHEREQDALPARKQEETG